jgi:maltose/moltooligosaccharide transporter
VILSLPVYFASLEKELYIFSIGLIIFGLLQMLAGYFKNISKNNGLTDIITDLYNMPQTMRQLAVVQFFSWFALFAMWIYTTPAVTSYIYGTTDAHSALYNEGANWVGGMFGYYNLFAAAFSFLLPVLAKYTNRKITHAIALVAGGIGLLSFYFIRNPSYLIFSMIGIGLAWASILAMPYAILTGALPQKKMGVYMGIFNFFIVIPQILAASILGFFTKTLFSGHAIYAILLGGASMIVAAFTVLLVNDK